MDHNEACFPEANQWRLCLEVNLHEKNLDAHCGPLEKTLKTCVTSWRRIVGPDVKVKGKNQGDPPKQCAAVSCLVERCLKDTKYNFDACSLITQKFKACVKEFYGSEYVI